MLGDRQPSEDRPNTLQDGQLDEFVTVELFDLILEEVDQSSVITAVSIDLSGKGFIESAKRTDANALNLDVTHPVELVKGKLLDPFIGIEGMIAGDEFPEAGEKVELILHDAGLLEFLEDEANQREGLSLVIDENMVVDLDDAQQDLRGFYLQLVVEFSVVEDYLNPLGYFPD